MESRLVVTWLKKLRKLGAFAERHHANGAERLGLHDIDCCYKGRYFAIEAKADFTSWKRWSNDKSEQSPTQKQVQREVRKAGGISICTWLWDNIALAVAMIDAGISNEEINTAVDAAQEEYVASHSRKARSSGVRRQERQRAKAVPANVETTGGKAIRARGTRRQGRILVEPNTLQARDNKKQ